MALSDKKISGYQDNVKELPDYPSDAGITAEQLKAIFDGRGDKEIKAAINGIIDELLSNRAAGQIKCADGKSIEEKLAELGISEEESKQLAGALEHLNNKENPHEVTASQVKMSSGKSVEEAILGSGGSGGSEVAKSLFVEGKWTGLPARMTVYPYISNGKLYKRVEVFDAQLGGWVVDHDAFLFDSEDYPELKDVWKIKEDLGNIDTALDAILAMQDDLIGGDA